MNQSISVIYSKYVEDKSKKDGEHVHFIIVLMPLVDFFFIYKELEW